MAGFAGCERDESALKEGGGDNGAEEYVYMSAEVKLPVGDNFATRSSTTGEGDDHPTDADSKTEVGKDYENTVQTCLLVITDANNKFLAVSAVNGIQMNVSDKTKFSATAKFDRKLVDALYEEGEDSDLRGDLKANEFHVFAFCNPSELLTQKMNAIARARLAGQEEVDWNGGGATSYDLADLTGIVDEDPMKPGATPTTSNNIWSPNRFMMANVSIHKVSLPVKKTDWDQHAVSEDAFDLTGLNDKDYSDGQPIDNGKSLQVERMAARFDYRDASGDISDGVKDDDDNPHNIYKVLGSMDSDAGTLGSRYNFVNIKLSRIGLVNMAKEIYYLKRVSDDGREHKDGTQSWTLLGKEHASPSFNYVVTPNADKKNNNTNVTTVREDGGWYNFTLFDEKGGYDKTAWSVYNLGDVTSNSDMDQWEGVNGKSYHIWRYCTENTIPAGTNATNRENQLQDNIFSTGIVFKGKLIAGQFLGRTRETMDPSDGTNKIWRPYMTYNSQRAILASTFGLDLKSGFSEQEFNKAKEDAAKENPKLENLQLYDPAKHTGENGGIKWTDLKYTDFNDMTSYPALYLFEGNLYAGFNEAAEYAYYDGKGGTLYQAMSDVMSHYYLKKVDPEKIKVDVDGNGEMEEVSGFVQMENPQPKADYVQLTVEIFAQILGLVPQESVDVVGGETYYDRALYGVRWVDTSAEKAEKETENFKDWVTNGTGSSFHFTIYDVSNETDNYGGESSTSQGYGYYCYYFYWNRHNDNGIQGVMAPMEFSVVRNNVYKLAVTQIMQLGHPIDPSNDPTPPGPHDDDEKSEVYMKVNVEVLPWTVRVNDIRF